MNEIKFDDSISSTNSNNDSLLYSRFNKSAERPTLVNLLMKKSGIGSEKTANAVLLIVSAIFFLSAVAIIYYSFYYTPTPRTVRGNVPPQALIMQKTQQYVGEGLSQEEARQRATDEVMLNDSAN
jgi:hypothetical protein